MPTHRLIAAAARHLGRLAAPALAALMLAGLAAPASAATIHLGPEELLRPLQDVRLQNAKGEAMYLGYKVSFHWLGLPYRVTNDGYVLGVKGRASYVAVDGSNLGQWQAQGYLPSPLPTYELSLADHILGNMLWIVIAMVTGWYALRTWLARRAGLAPIPAPHVPAARVARLSKAPPAAARASKRTDEPTPARVGSATPGTAPTAAQLQPVPIPPTQVARLPIARTRCRVKSLKPA